MTDLDTQLAAANDAIDRLERRWMALADAERHPRWTAGGELVLLGDLGTAPDGEQFTVIGLDLFGNLTVLWEADGLFVPGRNPTTCHTLTHRQRIPPATMEALAAGWQDQHSSVPDDQEPIDG